MGRSGRPQYDGFVEASSVQTVYCSGTAFVDLDGSNLVFAVYQTRIGADGSKEKVITANVVIPVEGWKASRDAANFALVQAETSGSTKPPGATHMAS